ncbi:MAG: hypothetical protein JNM84_20815 [Planctomycetes bacterium]|nr:hypothetical protein [Planctomycetota bacterium]
MIALLTRATHGAALVILAFLATSCASIVPDGFVPVASRYGRDLEALSADGALYTATSHPSPEEATLEFWTIAVKRELVERRGYAIFMEGDVRAKSGAPGYELCLRTPASLGDQRYLLTLFLESRWGENRVHVIEAAGPTDLVDPKLPAIREAIRASY